ncbi:MAG: hypothetical protein JJU00_01865 [Opitutales bacterium]|nr:hypothetical protein [Opitutales bacterium]
MTNPAAREKPPALGVGFVSLFFLILAVSGFLVVVGNLAGIAAGSRLLPVVDNLPGLMSTTLVLFAAGCLPVFLRSVASASKS